MNIMQAHGCAAQGENKILSSFYYALNLFFCHTLWFFVRITRGIYHVDIFIC